MRNCSHYSRYNIPEIKVLPKAEQIELIRKAQAGDVAARHAMIEQYIPFAMKLAGRNVTRYIDADDLINEAVFGIDRAIDKFEIERGHAFSTYCYLWMMQKIDRAKYNAKLIRIPVHLKGQVRRSVMSLDTPLSAEGNSETMAAVIADDDCPDAGLSLDQRELSVGVRRVVAELHPHYRGIVEARLNGETLDEIGQRMGLTRERVRQLEQHGLKSFWRRYRRRRPR